MGLFSKEECCFCHNKVGMLSRFKLKSGEFMCQDCQKKGNAFMHLAYMTKDQVAAFLAEAEASEKHFQEVQFNFRKTSRTTFDKTWTFYDNMQTGEFVLETPENKAYPNHYVFRMDQVFPFDKAAQFVSGSGGGSYEADRQRIYNMIKVEQRKNSEGKTEGWTLKMPYNKEFMEIVIKFPGSMDERDVRLFQSTIQAVVASYNTEKRLTPTQLQEIQKAGVSLGNDSGATNTAEALGSMFASMATKK